MGNIVLETVIAIALICLTGLLIPWLKTKTTAAQQDTLMKFVDAFVRAAEQIYGKELGKEKFSAVREWLVEKGYTDKEGDLEAAIEAAVYRLKYEYADRVKTVVTMQDDELD